MLNGNVSYFAKLKIYSTLTTDTKIGVIYEKNIREFNQGIYW